MMHFLQQTTFHKIPRRLVEMCNIFVTAFLIFFHIANIEKDSQGGWRSAFSI